MSQAPGWYRDPFLRGQERYWDGRLWTQGTRPAAGEGPDASADPTDHAHQSDQPQLPPPTPRAGEGSGRDAPSVPGAPSFAPLGAPASARPAVTTPTATSGPWAPPAVGTVAAPDAGHRGQEGRRHRAAFGVSAAAAVLIVAGLSAVFALGGGSSGEASASEAVVTAATQTIEAHSADVSMSMEASTLGVQESLTGSGAFDFAQKTGTMTMTIPVDGTQYGEQEIMDGSTVYVNVSDLDTGLAPSVPWVSVPVDQADQSATDISTLDAMSLLHQLQTVGGAVTSLGQTGYDGTTVTKYETTLPAAALESGMGALPSAAVQKALGLDVPDMTIDVYVTQDGLLKALVVPTYSFDIADSTISVEMTVTFSNYGTAVNVTPPPPDQVQTFQQFVSGLCTCASTGNTGNTGNSGAFGNSGSTA